MSNKAVSPQHIVQYISKSNVNGHYANKMFFSDEQINQLSLLTGLQPLNIEKLCIKENNNIVEFYSEPIHSRFITESRKICPLCVFEYGYMRKTWDLVTVTTCNKHNCLLIDRCERCGKQLALLRHDISKCDYCGCDLTSFWKKVPNNEVALSKLINDVVFKHNNESAHL